MPRPGKLGPSEVDAWLDSHPGWARDGEALVRTYRFPDFAGALAFTVHVGMIADKRDHHPDVTLGWGRAAVLWTTHDAGGVTRLDLELAEATDAVAARTGPDGSAG
jgi:4a-hydroxytetrahydrobiopterin dehydratase